MRGTYCTTLVLGFLLGGAVGVQAQTPDNPPAGPTPAAAPAPVPPPPSPLRQWGTEFSFMFDGYLDKSFNAPLPASTDCATSMCAPICRTSTWG
jgi:hypothetical protein